MRKKEATAVAGLATMTLGVAIVTTRRRCRPTMMEVIVLAIVAAIVTARNFHVMTSNAWQSLGDDINNRRRRVGQRDVAFIACLMQSLQCCSCLRDHMQQMNATSLQCCKDCSDVAEIPAMLHLLHLIAAVACNKCNITETANLEVYDCPSS
jgi:hypothetical protein